MQISDYLPFDIIKCLYFFFYLTHFGGQGRNSYNDFFFFGKFKTPQFVVRLSNLQEGLSKIIDFFLLFAIQVNGVLNYKEALRKAEQPQTSSLLNQILQTVRERFPGQSDDNLLTMILEVCKLSLFTRCFDEKRIF